MGLPRDFELSVHAGGEGDLPEVEATMHPKTSSGIKETIQGLIVLPAMPLVIIVLLGFHALEELGIIKK